MIATDLALVVLVGALCRVLGWRSYLQIELPTIMLAGAAGIWLFYLKLPKLLQFFSGNIGLHHVHHLSARIPNYNLQRAHDENPIFHEVPVITLADGLRAVKLKLYDEQQKRMVTFSQAD